ncbi:MAG: HypC/HybG/HupF family hydrogenase formation chaperone [Chloroflexota bacterium]
MCLAVPALVRSVHGHEAEVDIGGVRRNISIFLTPQVRAGDYVLLHTGYAINIIDQAEAAETLRLLNELADAADVLDGEITGS